MCTTTSASLSAAEIRTQTKVLTLKIAGLVQGGGLLDKEIRDFHAKIRELQRHCPHENVEDQPVENGSETKHLPFCADCGAEIRQKTGMFE